MTKLTMALVLVLAGCSHATAPEVDADPCAPPGPEADWCHHLDNDAVADSLLTLPDSAYHLDSPSHSTSL
jgi:hypothetical protein